ncbi:MAG TPA: cupredoxin family copper-binding protein [Longimicrobiales bacterium]|nr:cupredoxin family copper-binding protein [Longimicrobiales bacterium]
MRWICCGLLAALLVRPVGAQTLERTMLVGSPDAGLPWLLEFAPEFRLERAAGAGLVQRGTFDIALGLPAWARAGLRVAPESRVVQGSSGEWELRAAATGLALAREAPADLAITAAVNGAAGSLDVDVTAAHRAGPVRVMASGRLFTDGFGAGDARTAVGAGVAWSPWRTSVPVTLSADVVTLLTRDAPERVAWSAAVATGLPFSPYRISVFATNTASGTLQGTSRGSPRTRLGVSLVAPLEVGRAARLVASRQQARRAVVADVPAAATGMVSTTIEGFSYPQYRLEVLRGTTVEWTNRDAVMHTVSADDSSWDSGAIQPGASWRARFDEPGIYSFHCGPHPWMKGVVVVR